MTSVPAWYAWLKGPSRNDFVYHTGLLMADRVLSYKVAGLFPVIAPVPHVDNIGKAAWAAYLDGRVFLLQRKLGFGKYEYIARKRLHPAQPKKRQNVLHQW